MKTAKSLLLIFFALAIFASVFVCQTAFAEGQKPWNIVVDVTHDGKVFCYNLQSELPTQQSNSSARGFFLGKAGKKALAEHLLESHLPTEAVCEYLLPNFRKLTEFFRFVNRQKCDATVSFDENGFHFCEGQNGVSIDKKRLLFAMLESCGRHRKLSLPLLVDRAVTVADLQKNTVKKASFTTYFAGSGDNRCHNVAQATASLNGTTVAAGEVFSFNQIVGPRTEQNGYKNAKVILDGMYTDGVGGGVCQVSTTLYNALLLAEIIPKAAQHSLVSSYVMAGFDAMVSDGGADLTFLNNTEHNMYIAGSVNMQNKSVTFTIYGRPNTYKVERQNSEVRTKFQTVEVTDLQKFPELIYTDQTKVICGGSDGVVSKSYLCYYKDGILVERKLFRQNNYKKVDRIIARGSKIRSE